MPVPPAVSCASDRASAPRLATVQKRREVGHCFNVRKVARCFCRRQKCAYEGGNGYTPVFRRRKATRRSGRKVCLFPAVVKGICYCPVRFAAGFLLFAELQIGRFFPLRLRGVGGKVENSFSRGFIYGGSFPDSFDSAQPRGGGRFAPSSKASLLLRALCGRVFARCGIDKTDGFARR